jgi:hypothetical protein
VSTPRILYSAGQQLAIVLHRKSHLCNP